MGSKDSPSLNRERTMEYRFTMKGGKVIAAQLNSDDDAKALAGINVTGLERKLRLPGQPEQTLMMRPLATILGFARTPETAVTAYLRNGETPKVYRKYNALHGAEDHRQWTLTGRTLVGGMTQEEDHPYDIVGYVLAPAEVV